jgi:hypothetical protein
MKRLLPLFCILILVFAPAGAASAEPPQPDVFSTTGYTTNLAPIPVGPTSLPTEFEILAPSLYAKFHIKAQGGPAVDNDAQCSAIYGVPTCSALCIGFGVPSCGAAGFFDGSFTFDEWGIVDLITYAGANHGLLDITTSAGVAKARFGGNASLTGVSGSFSFLKGSGDYHNLKGGGTYAGGAGLVFRVDYAPCGGKGGPACPASRCAVFGDDLKMGNSKAEWRIDNEGEQTTTLNTLFIYWPSENGDLQKVRLGGKVLWDGSKPAPAVELMLDTDAGNREIKAGKSEKLTLEFANKKISQEASDYTILASFDGACAVPFVAFQGIP